MNSDGETRGYLKDYRYRYMGGANGFERTVSSLWEGRREGERMAMYIWEGRCSGSGSVAPSLRASLPSVSRIDFQDFRALSKQHHLAITASLLCPRRIFAIIVRYCARCSFLRRANSSQHRQHARDHGRVRGSPSQGLRRGSAPRRSTLLCLPSSEHYAGGRQSPQGDRTRGSSPPSRPLPAAATAAHRPGRRLHQGANQVS